MSGHILKTYDDNLHHLKDMVLEMGGNAVLALEKSINGLIEGDRELCAEVIDDDEVIDAAEKKIDEQGMSILLRYNPVASDLRLVFSSINICRSLERIGDHAVNIAKRSRKILKGPGSDQTRLLEPLYLEARKIVSAAMTAYSDVDEKGGHAVIEMDRLVDDAHKSLTKSLSSRIADQEGEGGKSTEAMLNILFISRSLERIGDLAVNIAEDVVFITSAEDIRHT